MFTLLTSTSELILSDYSPTSYLCSRRQNFKLTFLEDLSTKKQPLFVPDILNDPGSAPYELVYDNFFRCLYNLHPLFSNRHTDGAHRFVMDAIDLLKAAESLKAVAVVRLIIEANFLRLNQQLWRNIAQSSVAWADVATRLQSPILFKVAMAHIVGRFDLRGLDGIDKEFLRGQPNGEMLLRFAAAKARELKDKKLRIERCLVEFYPSRMIHPREPNRTIGRDVYANDIYLWQALTLVRQHLSSAYLANMHHRARDGGASFYYSLAKGGNAYLGPKLLGQFNETFSMSTKAKDRLVRALAYIKESMKPIVAELLVDESQINRGPDEPPPRYLTCCKILDKELPWVVNGANE